jgi:hypothetical protein
MANSMLWAFALAKSEIAFFALLFPGMFPAMIVCRCDVEDLTWPGILTLVLTELLFYYFIAWCLIRAFRPAASWWPEKRA